MSKELTEQWRNGTLEHGLYYTRSSSGRKGFSFHTGSKRHMFSPYDRMAHQVEEVLATVPNYEKVKEMSQKIERLEFDNEALEMAHNEGKEINAELVSKNEQLEEDNKYLKSGIETRDKQIEQLVKQLKEANEVIKWYDGLENILIGWEICTGQKKGTAHKYLKKWGVE